MATGEWSSGLEGGVGAQRTKDAIAVMVVFS